MKLKYENYASRLVSFFEGRAYPLIVALLVLFGYISTLEFYFNILLVFLFCLSLLVCDNACALLPMIFMWICQIPKIHTPAAPTFSDYYTVGHRPFILIVLLIGTLLCFIFYVIKNAIPKIRRDKPPLFLPTSLLCLSFVLNGALSNTQSTANLLFGLGEAAMFFILFYVIYYGVPNGESERFIKRLIYLSLVFAFVLLFELLWVYISVEGVISNGVIVKEKLIFGWSHANPFGFQLSVLIPPIMLGAIKAKKHSEIYMLVALLVLAGAIFTLSRGAILFSFIGFSVSLIIALIYAEKRRALRRAAVIFIISGAVFIFTFSDKILTSLQHVISFGFSDNGRFALWRHGIKNFISNPLFGVGFFGFGDGGIYEGAGFLPDMAHNTAVQLLSSCGIAGFLSYIFYRAKTLFPLFKTPSAEKFILYLIIGLTLAASLIDNFIFYFHSITYYLTALALIFRAEKDARLKNRRLN